MHMKLLVTAVITVIASPIWAASSQDASELGKSLTQVGAEKAGNKDGTIPAWDGNDAPLSGYSFGKQRSEYWKFKDEKPLFSIDAANADKYVDKLAPGQLQLIKQTKGYQMDIYRSHRNCGYPDWIQANTKKNVTAAKIGSNGWTLQNAHLPGTPFPVPQSG